jgi:5-methylcytosine-specific restriction endonuclease McrA
MTETCFYCGMIVRHLSVAGRQHTPQHHRTRDHKVPKARGGTKAIDNIVTACLKCNTDKGALTVEEYRLVLAHRRGLVQSTNLVVFPGENRGHVNGALTETTMFPLHQPT